MATIMPSHRCTQSSSPADRHSSKTTQWNLSIQSNYSHFSVYFWASGPPVCLPTMEQMHMECEFCYALYHPPTRTCASEVRFPTGSHIVFTTNQFSHLFHSSNLGIVLEFWSTILILSTLLVMMIGLLLYGVGTERVEYFLFPGLAKRRQLTTSMRPLRVVKKKTKSSHQVTML